MKKKLLYILSASLFLSLSSCEELSDFGDTNKDPSVTTDPSIAALLTNVESHIGGYASESRAGMYAQYFSETQYSDASLYSIPQIDHTGIYSGDLYDLENIKAQNQSNNMNVVATILQQYIFLNVTDKWGEVPYSEALKGVDFSRPKYDTQETIYKGIIATLKTAVTQFDGSFIGGDVIFGGDIAQWKRTANSIRLMAALQLSKRYKAASEYAATEFKAALNDPAGIIATNAQNFVIKYPGGNFKSDWFNTYNGRKDLAESATLTTLMGSLSDVRQTVFGGATESQTTANANASSNIGVPYGVVRATAEAFTAANPNWARVLRGDKRTESSPVYVLTASQVMLARAEAADYGWTTENVSAIYRQGIELSYEQWGLTAPASYFTQSAVALSAAAGTGANLPKIATQQYVASYPNGMAAWNLWRRTGYPVLTPAVNAVNSSRQIVRRYTYASNEYTSNEINVKEAVARLAGGDSQDSRVWWDQ